MTLGMHQKTISIINTEISSDLLMVMPLMVTTTMTMIVLRMIVEVRMSQTDHPAEKIVVIVVGEMMELMMEIGVEDNQVHLRLLHQLSFHDEAGEILTDLDQITGCKPSRTGLT